MLGRLEGGVERLERVAVHFLLRGAHDVEERLGAFVNQAYRASAGSLLGHLQHRFEAIARVRCEFALAVFGLRVRHEVLKRVFERPRLAEVQGAEVKVEDRVFAPPGFELFNREPLGELTLALKVGLERAQQSGLPNLRGRERKETLPSLTILRASAVLST